MCERILLVEDDPVVRDGVVEVLKAAGYRVWHAATPEQALEVAARAAVDAVVTDYRLPAMDGAALLARSTERVPTLRRKVIYSAAQRPRDPERSVPNLLWVPKAAGHRALLRVLDSRAEVRDEEGR